ncbi:hypothetical protein LTS18_012394, partial [Coniosporium uncinatum]
AKKKAAIRVAAGRATPIDWLAATLSILDPSKDIRDDDAEVEIDVIDPEAVFEGLSDEQLHELEEGVNTYLALETRRSNREYWDTMKIICQNRRRATDTSKRLARGASSVSVDVNKILGPKSFEELVNLETQIRKKLNSDESIDFDYWEHLLSSLLVFKAQAKLRKVSQDVIKARLDDLKQKHHDEAVELRDKLLKSLGPTVLSGKINGTELNPDSMLRVPVDDKNLEVVVEQVFLDKIVGERRRIVKLGYVPASKNDRTDNALNTGRSEMHRADPAASNDDSSEATAAYEREVARGLNENEEIFAKEETLPTGEKPQWAEKHKPRKPRYFNRVQMGYEWNKYNQTHYDHDNPPPKVVQGYKFNVFYPNLIDSSKAPTYRIERDTEGKLESKSEPKPDQALAPTWEENTCLLRFMAGPPYKDIAFRIIDKEWEYSAKRERGFKSTFDKGILQLHFQFKKVYYRK